MMDVLYMFLILVLSPIWVLLTLGFLFSVNGFLNWIFDTPDALYCDIDPLCHPAFYFDSEGNGWIDGRKV